MLERSMKILIITVLTPLFVAGKARAADVVPDKDPAVEGAPAQLVPAVMATHPRLLCGPQDLPRLREFYKSDKSAPYRLAFEKYLPACVAPAKPAFLKDATDGQRQGLWRLPTVALHYALTGDRRSFDRSVTFLKLFQTVPHWEEGEETDSGMSAANIMIGAALAYDLLYSDLPADFREQFRQTLWLHARAMYCGGHLMKQPGIHYWQNDPQNNHRWHRDAGLIMAAMAASNGSPEEQWLLRQIADEMKLINDWLPADGTSHESPSYLVFGASHLTLADNVADRCLGTHYLQAPFYQRVTGFLLQCTTPGMQSIFQYGDSGQSAGYYGCFAFKAACANHEPDALAGVQALMKADPDLFSYQWMSLLWVDPNAPVGSARNLPATSFFNDLGLAFMRDGWDSKNVGVMFKCGPLGGYKLNEFRKAFADKDGLRYINVAHDDPDANSFIIWSNGAFVAETDRYSQHKRSANHNTILVNGMGQMVPGRMEDQVFSQPAVGNFDMSQMAVVTAFKDAGEVVAVEGEAAGSYLAVTDAKHHRSRPALDRYRRTFIWVRGSYLLVLDDIRAPEPVDITWLMQAPKLTPRADSDLTFDLAHKDATCTMQIRQIGNVELHPVIGVSPADDKSKILGWQQLQLGAQTKDLKLATLFMPWGGDAKVKVEKGAAGVIQLNVTAGNFHDVWQWTPASDNKTASHLTGQRNGGFSFDLK